MRRALLVIMLATACGRAPAADSTDGAEVFVQMCATCHGTEGKPSSTMVARMTVRDLTSPELRARLTAETVEQQVRRGSANKLMPGFEGALTAEQIKAVSEYVANPKFPAQ